MNDINSSFLVEVKNLALGFQTELGLIRTLHGVDLKISPSEFVGIVGESGCGKSITAMSMLNLLPYPSVQYFSGEFFWKGEAIHREEDENWHKLRGKKIGMIFQEPMTALNPVRTVGSQILENLTLHASSLSKSQLLEKAEYYFSLVGINDAKKRLKLYPHELSGGLRQRVMIAMALCTEPELLIADEPTTALDVTIQAQILDLLVELQRKLNMSVLFISHDLDVVTQVCDRVFVMYGGVVVEHGNAKDILSKPLHPYTQSLMASIPRLDLKPKEKLFTLKGQVKSQLKEDLNQCPFVDRCSLAMDVCKNGLPSLENISSNRQLRCLLGGKI